jgi:hypothetical protein
LTEREGETEERKETTYMTERNEETRKWRDRRKNHILCSTFRIIYTSPFCTSQPVIVIASTTTTTNNNNKIIINC